MEQKHKKNKHECENTNKRFYIKKYIYIKKVLLQSYH